MYIYYSTRVINTVNKINIYIRIIYQYQLNDINLTVLF